MTAETIEIDIGKQDLGKFANALDCTPFYSLKEITEAKSTKQLKELAFEQNEYKDVLRWADGIGSKPRYTPEKEEFLRYADWDYYEHTPQIEALTTFFVKEVKLTRTHAAQLVDDIHDLCPQEVKLQAIMDMLEKKETQFASFDMAQNFSELHMQMHNHTRIRFNKGHTSNEIFTLYCPTMSTHRRVAKVGTKAPCPCGSGKKCCGLLS